MTITYLESVDSTQTYLKKLINEKSVQPPHAVVANIQTDGIGSRGNSWTGMAISLEDLPKDLKLESASIYFAYLLKETLFELNSSTWLKWPNDFYIDNLKIGGMITNITGNTLVCGVGLNLVASPKEFTILDIRISNDELLKLYLKKIEKKISWKQVFSKYKLEFCLNKNFFANDDNLRILLGDAELQSDGSIISNGERIYSRR